jgi:hypothetical protein
LAFVARLGSIARTGRRGDHHLHRRLLLAFEQLGEAGLFDHFLDLGAVEQEDHQNQQHEGDVKQAADGIALAGHILSYHRHCRRVD